MKHILQYLSRNKSAYFFIAPGIAIIAFLILFPIIQSVIMSFTDWYLLSTKLGHPFVGLANYQAIFSMSQFQTMLRVTALYTILTVSGKMFLGLGTALLLNRKFFGRGIVRAIMVIPWAMPTLVVCIVFRVALDPVFGLLNSMLLDLNIIHENINFLLQPTLALTSVIIIAIWRYFPFVTLMLLAALHGIPEALYEVASIDGANVWQKFAHITWPLLKPVWTIVLILQIVWTVKEFDLVYLVTRGGPDFATELIGIDVYVNAFQFYELGIASAEGMFLILFSILFAVIYVKFVGKKGNI
ncbi:Inner membrane ABC transporter permease protein YcjO [subsurface metagenome]